MMNVDSEGRLKRFEYRGKYLRASRTGGTSLRAQAKAAGLNFTVNSKHGVRVSTRVAKGTNVGIQVIPIRQIELDEKMDQEKNLQTLF